MSFKELKEGDVVYCITVKNSEIINGKIKPKIIGEINNYTETDKIEIHFTDKTMIIPGKEESYLIKGFETLSNNLNPFNFTLYGTSFDLCKKIIDRIVSTKITQLTEDYKKVGTQMARLCLMRSIIEKIEKASSIVLEPIYAD